MALPVVVNIISVAVLAVEDDDEPIPHPMTVPREATEAAAAAATSTATSTATTTTSATESKTGETEAVAPRFLDLALDKAHAFSAQRLLLSFEFLRPAFAAIKRLYAAERISECMWLIHHLDRVLLRYSHSTVSQSSSLHRSSGGGGGGGGSGGTGPNEPPSLPDHVRLLMLGLKYLSAGIFLHWGDSERAYQAIRLPLSHAPYSFPLAHTMNLILNLQSYPGKSVKLLERLLAKHPDALPLQMMLAHGCLVHQNYESALTYYLRLHNSLPSYSLLPLLIGVTKLQLALKKTNRQRHNDLMIAFAFLSKYQQLRKQANTSQPQQAEQEACYNVARAYQYVGLFYMARPLYERVLAISTAPTIATPPSEGSKRPTRVSSLHMEAAHNLAIVYSQTGSPELARRLYAQYCRV